jgi:hypothetical protein
VRSRGLAGVDGAVRGLGWVEVLGGVDFRIRVVRALGAVGEVGFGGMDVIVCAGRGLGVDVLVYA